MTGTVSARWFFPDWLSDPGLRASSLAARGLWKDLICIAAANKEDQYGFVLINGKSPSPKELARLLQATPREIKKLLAELHSNGVCSVSREGFVYCRRMVRAQKNRQNGRLGGNPTLLKQKEDQDSLNHNPVNQLGYPPPGKLPVPVPVPVPKESKKDSPINGHAVLVFESGVIHLTEKDFNRWKECFPLLELRAELEGLAEWAGQQRNWFPAVSGALAKKNREEKRKREMRDEKKPFDWHDCL